MSYYVEIRKLLFLLYSCLCLFQISLNINTFKQQQKKTSLLSFLHSSHLPLCVPSQSTDISVSRPSEVMRTLIDQLFQQEMRGHLSEACLNRVTELFQDSLSRDGRTALLTQADVSHISRPGPDLRGVRCMQARECTKKHECILCMFWDYCCVVFAHTDSLCCLICQRLVEV